MRKKISENMAKMGWNYRMVVFEDRSGGVRNPGFAKFLIETRIDVLK